MIKPSVPIRHIEMCLVEERTLKISLQVMQFQRVEMTAGTFEDRAVWQKHRMRKFWACKGYNSKQKAERKTQRKISFGFYSGTPALKGEIVGI